MVANRINAIKLRSSFDHRDETSIEFGVDSGPLLLERMVVGCDLMPMVGVLRDGGEKPIDGGHAVQPVHNKREHNSVPVI